MAGKKVLHLEELFQREFLGLARDEALLDEAFTLFRKAASNAVLGDLLTQIKREAADLAQKAEALVEDKIETRRDAVRGIIEEGQKRAKEIGDHHLVDVELIFTAQRLLGYQAAGYRSVLPLTRLLGLADATLLCEAAVDAKERAIRKLQKTALHQVHWRVKWWAPEHTSAWQKVKQVFRDDWVRTKEHLGISQEDETDEQSVQFDTDEPSFRYGYGAAIHYQDKEWNKETEQHLRSEYGGLWDENTGTKVRMGWDFSRNRDVNR